MLGSVQAALEAGEPFEEALRVAQERSQVLGAVLIGEPAEQGLLRSHLCLRGGREQRLEAGRGPGSREDCMRRQLAREREGRDVVLVEAPVRRELGHVAHDDQRVLRARPWKGEGRRAECALGEVPGGRADLESDEHGSHRRGEPSEHRRRRVLGIDLDGGRLGGRDDKRLDPRAPAVECGQRPCGAVDRVGIGGHRGSRHLRDMQRDDRRQLLELDARDGVRIESSFLVGRDTLCQRPGRVEPGRGTRAAHGLQEVSEEPIESVRPDVHRPQPMARPRASRPGSRPWNPGRP